MSRPEAEKQRTKDTRLVVGEEKELLWSEGEGSWSFNAGGRCEVQCHVHGAASIDGLSPPPVTNGYPVFFDCDVQGGVRDTEQYPDLELGETAMIWESTLYVLNNRQWGAGTCN